MSVLLGLIRLMRPKEWTKTFTNMLLGAVLATMPVFFDWKLFLWAFLFAGPLFWGGAYMLNDWTDREKDKLHAQKKLRPIPSGQVSANTALFAAISLIVIALVGAYTIDLLLFAVLLIMLINHLLYTLPPIRLKERHIFDLISGSMVNPEFRFFAGWVIFAHSFNAPIWIILMLIGMQVAGYNLYRASGRHVETKLGYKSSAARFSDRQVKVISYTAAAIAGLSYVWACTIGPLGPKFFIPAVGAGLAFLPLAGTIKKPHTITEDRKQYRKAYHLTFLGAFIFAVLFAVVAYL